LDLRKLNNPINLKGEFVKNRKKLFILIFICIFFLYPQKSYAASNVVDKSINLTCKTAYYITKYTLKTLCFIVKETAKGVKAVSIGIFNGTIDAFISAATTKIDKPHILPVNKKSDSIYTLPPAPKIY
jgi:hypothetical protein